MARGQKAIKNKKNKRAAKPLSLALAVVLLAASLTACVGKTDTVGTIGAESDGKANVGADGQTADQATSQADGQAETEPETEDLHPYEFTLCFAGDISLADGAVTTQQLEANDGDISQCIDPELIEHMTGADFMLLNNEFTYSTNGSPLEGKAYTFRANPERVSVLKDLGVDMVGLANNHVYDYGKQALLDTFTTLEDAEIPYVGAGHNLEEAMTPQYVEIDGLTIAIVAASRAEKNKMTPQATEDSPGILRCYDTTLFLQEIQEADANADIVIAYVHWGTEYSTTLEDVQVSTAKDYIDAGADVIIGAHSHCLQGIGYYEDVPIFYSLGNYWFNEKTLYTMLVELTVTGDDNGYTITPSIVPGLQSGCKTTYLDTADKQRELYDYLEGISTGVEIDDAGLVHEVGESAITAD